MLAALGWFTFAVLIIVFILIHEAAHFWTARRYGIKVEEFFVGFGPRIWATRRGETEYGVKAFVLGGYVRIAGMNPFREPTEGELPRTFGAKPIEQRAVVIVSGPATHFVLAFAFFALWLGIVGQPRVPVFDAIAPRLAGQVSPAAAAGMKPGDRVIAIGPIQDPTADQLLTYTRAHPGEPIAFRIQRGDRAFTVTMTPILAKVAGQEVARVGVVLSEARQTSGPVGSIVDGAKLVGVSLWRDVQNLGRLFGPEGLGRVVQLVFGNAQRRPTDPTSVIGAGRVAGQVASGGHFGDILVLFAGLNVWLGLLNLLPLLPFDGGHLAVLAIEKARGRPIDARKLVPITAAVATFLILFMVGLVYLDITKPLPNLFR